MEPGCLVHHNSGRQKKQVPHHCPSCTLYACSWTAITGAHSVLLSSLQTEDVFRYAANKNECGNDGHMFLLTEIWLMLL